ncbi:MAG: hypothetical protein WCS86_03210 [Candidatus Paceibacterota bacterium]
MSYDEEDDLLKVDGEDGEELMDPLEEPLEFTDPDYEEEDPDKDH